MSKKDTLVEQNLSDFSKADQRGFAAAMNHSLNKFDNGTWVALPEAFHNTIGENWIFSLRFLDSFPYYAHVSTNDASQIAYYPTIQRFLEDRPVTTRAGRLFRKAIPMNRDDAVVASVTNEYMKHLNPPELKWARTEEEIEYVFRNGPRSCMGGIEKEADGECYLLSKIHPSRVYATDSLGVAYLEKDNGAISSRTVVNMKDKEYNRIYGNVSHLREALKINGYKGGTLGGCKVKIIKDENDLVIMPYIDNCEALIYDDNEHYTIVEGDCDGEGYSREEVVGTPHETSGYLEEVQECNKDGCDCVYLQSGDQGSYIAHKGTYCKSCFDKEDTVESRHEGCSILRSQATYLTYKDDWYMTNDIQCVIIDGEMYLENKLSEVGMYIAGNHRLVKSEYATYDQVRGVWCELDRYDKMKVDKLYIASNVKMQIKKTVKQLSEGRARLYGIDTKGETLPKLVDMVAEYFYYKCSVPKGPIVDVVMPLVTKEHVELVWEAHSETKKHNLCHHPDMSGTTKDEWLNHTLGLDNSR
tara:strand:+ start:5528 stop:7111 length:1584 start_codon:yes stop_codon:yes gene_type:complete